MIVHVAVLRSFDPLDLDVRVFADIEEAERWCNDVGSQIVDDEDLFVFSCEVVNASPISE